MLPKTRVKATNWPTRDTARDTMPRNSRKGQNVASPSKREQRLMRAAARSIPELLERAQRDFARMAGLRAIGADPGAKRK